jgi:hypothetical protein
VAVGRFGNELAEIIERPRAVDFAGHRIDLPEGADEQQHQRRQIEHDEP